MPATYQSQSLDHLGLVAAMFDALGIGDVIDQTIDPRYEQEAGVCWPSGQSHGPQRSGLCESTTLPGATFF